MTTPLFDSPGIYSSGGSYFSQKSPEEWEKLRSIANESGSYLPEITMDDGETVAPLCAEWRDTVTQIKDLILKGT